MPLKQKKSTASEETEEVDDEVEGTEVHLKDGQVDDNRAEESRKKHKSRESSKAKEATDKEKKKKEGEKDKKKKKRPDEAKNGVIENKSEEDEQNNNGPTNHEVTEGGKEENKKKKKKSSGKNTPEGSEAMGSKDKKSKDGKKKKKSHNDDDEEPLIEEEEEDDAKKKKKKKAKKGSADSDEDKKKKGKKSKSKQVDYAVIYQKELLEYHTDSSDGYEDEYYKKKGRSREGRKLINVTQLRLESISGLARVKSKFSHLPSAVSWGAPQGIPGCSNCSCMKAQLCSTWLEANRRSGQTSPGCRPSASPSGKTAAGARAGHGLQPGHVHMVINIQLHVSWKSAATATKFQRKKNL